jgi:hypothetical protein
MSVKRKVTVPFGSLGICTPYKPSCVRFVISRLCQCHRRFSATCTFLFFKKVRHPCLLARLPAFVPSWLPGDSRLSGGVVFEEGRLRK